MCLSVLLKLCLPVGFHVGAYLGLLLQLFQTCAESQDSSTGVDLASASFTNMKELARRFSLTFGWDQVKSRESVAMIHKYVPHNITLPMVIAFVSCLFYYLILSFFFVLLVLFCFVSIGKGSNLPFKELLEQTERAFLLI